MTDDEAELSSAAAGREGLTAQLRQLEEFVARTESSGDELPPEAVEMIARLREIVQALDGLTSSMQGESDSSGQPPRHPPEEPPEEPPDLTAMAEAP